MQTVKITDNGENIELKLTPELINLFESRLEEDKEEATAWYIKKSD